MYITAQEYSDYTGRDSSEATSARIKRASRLLDVRIGYYPDRDDFKLTVSDLKAYQQDAVKTWVAFMIEALVINDDSVQVNEAVSLGRFSVEARDGDDTIAIPDQVKYADMQLKDAGLIRRAIPTQRRRYGHAGYYL